MNQAAGPLQKFNNSKRQKNLVTFIEKSPIFYSQLLLLH